MKKNSIILTEAEITSLIKASSRENKLDLCFGGELLPVPSNDWAFKMVEEMRKPKDKILKDSKGNPLKAADIMALLEEILNHQVANRKNNAFRFYRSYDYSDGKIPEWVAKAEQVLKDNKEIS